MPSMITVDFLGEKGFEVKGHSGFGEEGSDIVCASVSSAVYLTANMLSESAGKQIEAEIDEGFLKIMIKKPDEISKIILHGLKIHLEQIADQYPEYVIINH